jgi:hypothetical protein
MGERMEESRRDESKKDADGERHAARPLGEHTNEAFNEMGVPGMGEPAGDANGDRGGELINDDCGSERQATHIHTQVRQMRGSQEERACGEGGGVPRIFS